MEAITTTAIIVKNSRQRSGFRSICQGFCELAYDLKGMVALGGVTTVDATA